MALFMKHLRIFFTGNQYLLHLLQGSSSKAITALFVQPVCVWVDVCVCVGGCRCIPVCISEYVYEVVCGCVCEHTSTVHGVYTLQCLHVWSCACFG